MAKVKSNDPFKRATRKWLSKDAEDNDAIFWRVEHESWGTDCALRIFSDGNYVSLDVDFYDAASKKNKIKKVQSLIDELCALRDAMDSSPTAD